MSLIVGLIIWIMAHLKRYNALTIMAIVFLSITLDNVNQTTDLPVLFAFNRTLDTLIGVVISIIINGLKLALKNAFVRQPNAKQAPVSSVVSVFQYRAPMYRQSPM